MTDRSKKLSAIRWGDNDRYFGPFTFIKDRSYRPFAIVVGSGDGDEYPECSLRISAAGFTVIMVLPALIKPWRKWVDTSHYSWSKNPAVGYWATGKREYGFSLYDGFLSVSLGRVTDDSSTEQRWSKFLPWTQWRQVRHSHYGLTGDIVWTEPKLRRYDPERCAVENAAREAVPTVSFDFLDYDQEPLSVIARIEEREWHFGEGWFKWLSAFRKPKVSRYLDLRFSSETGRRKGSWKGGTIGHGIDMLPGELHESAFARYCEEHDMTFVGKSSAPNNSQEPT